MEPLKILIVDDNVDKLRHVINCINSVPGCTGEHIHSARDANEARRYLKENQYDLMILDISLPERPENLPAPDGGIRLLEEVLERDIYFKPREVVGLTAFTEVLESAGRRFAEDLWQVVQYDPTDDTWMNQLQRKVRYILLAKRSGPLRDYDNYLCVLTVLPTSERGGVLKIPWAWERFELKNDPTVYHRGVVVKDGVNRPIVAASASRMGMTAAAILSMKMINQFRPHYLAIAGILAGVSGRCSIGDIIAADPCWDWGSGKYQVKKGQHQFAAAPYQVNINSFLRSKLSLLSTTASDLDEIRRGGSRWGGGRGLEGRLRRRAGGAPVL